MPLVAICRASDLASANSAAAATLAVLGPETFSVALSTNQAKALDGSAAPTHYAGSFAAPTPEQVAALDAFTSAQGAAALGRQQVNVTGSVDAALAALPTPLWRIIPPNSGPVV